MDSEKDKGGRHRRTYNKRQRRIPKATPPWSAISELQTLTHGGG